MSDRGFRVRQKQPRPRGFAVGQPQSGRYRRLLETVVSDAVLDRAYVWLCKRRRDYPDHADVWTLRLRWQEEKPRLRHELLSGRFRFEVQERVTLRSGEDVDVWCARDALVLKALALVLAPLLPVSLRCVHVKGHGGAKAAVRQVFANLPDNRFVFRTDVKSYYASIDHHLLYERLARHIGDFRVLSLLWRYMRRHTQRGCDYLSFAYGISLGCPLSPLLGALFLAELDSAMESGDLFYVRFMDDVLVLAPTRWKLRRAVAKVNSVFDELKLKQHPDKTFVGRIERGFDFLGYHFAPGQLTLAKKTIENFVSRASRLYEQEPDGSFDRARLWEYVRRWWCWVRSGLGRLNSDLSSAPDDSTGQRECEQYESPGLRDRGGLGTQL